MKGKKMKKTDSQTISAATTDINAERLSELRQLMPDLFDAEGYLDPQALQNLAQPDKAIAEERFAFSWPGKQESKYNAHTSSSAALIPDKARSVNFDTTQNLIIEGDNLEVLKLLKTSYFEQVKCIYIDPPYNTGNDFIYMDSYIEDIESYWEKNGNASEGVKLVSLTESNGRRHSKWLNMMQSRLLVSRLLLRKDGVLITHIDENEVHRLRFLLEEIFGAENFIGEIIWNKRNPKGDSRGISYQHESILIFAKNFEEFSSSNPLEVPKKNTAEMFKAAKKFYKRINEKETTEAKYTLEDANKDYKKWVKSSLHLSGGEAGYDKLDETGAIYQSVSMAWPNRNKAPDEYRIPLIHPVTKKPCPVPKKGWRNPPAKMEELLKKNLIIFGVDEKTQPRRKYLLEENLNENLASILDYGGSDDRLLENMGITFEHSKPTEVAKRLLTGFTEEDDIVIDFFAGSATTAHAVMELNAQTNSKIKYILVQVPEIIDKKHPAFKAGYRKISEICIQRAKLAGEMIAGEHQTKQIDIGFRVYTLTSSFIPENLFKNDPDLSSDENLNALKEYIDKELQVRLFDDRDFHNIITEIALKNGYGLFPEVEELKSDFKKNRVFQLEGNGLKSFICLDENLDKESVKMLVNSYSDHILILSKYSINTEKMLNLKNAFGSNLQMV